MNEGYDPYNNEPSKKKQVEDDTIDAGGIDFDKSKDHLEDVLMEGVPKKEEWIDAGTRRSEKTEVREDRLREAA